MKNQKGSGVTVELQVHKLISNLFHCFIHKEALNIHSDAINATHFSLNVTTQGNIFSVWMAALQSQLDIAKSPIG